MFNHRDLQELRDTSLKMQGWIRKQTFSPQMEKTLRRFSSWEVSELIFKVNQSTFRGRLAAEPGLPDGEVEEDGRQRWFSLDEINEMRRKMKVNRKTLMPHRPAGKRAIRVAVANFKGGAGKSTVALHFAHAAALDGYRVLCVDFDPQATLSHSMGLSDVNEEHTVWGIMARDLVRETERMNRAVRDVERRQNALVRLQSITVPMLDVLAGFCIAAILLISTMIRLSLNIATTRVILSHGHEGHSAAGGVGSALCQLGRLHGCRVVGVAGGAQRGDARGQVQAGVGAVHGVDQRHRGGGRPRPGRRPTAARHSPDCAAPADASAPAPPPGLRRRSSR